MMLTFPYQNNRQPRERFKEFIPSNWALILSILVLWLVVAICLIVSIWKTQGHIGYALDDAYIHMAVAKNIAHHGIWGVTEYEFSSASSSILWTLLLASIYYFFGSNELTPLILNIIFSTFIVLIFYYFLKQEKCSLSQAYIAFFLLLAIFITPMPALIFGGMEHILQCLLSLSFCYLSAKIISQEYPEIKKTDLLLLLALSALVATVRYEGLFLIFVVFCLFLFRQRYVYALILGTVAVFPILVFGIYSISHGGLFLPNSVLLKSRISYIDIRAVKDILMLLGGFAYKTLYDVPYFLVLLLIASSAFFLNFNPRRGWKQANLIIVVIFVFPTLLHLNFAKIGWFFRYEAYLVLLGIFTITIALARQISAPNLLKKFSKNSIINIPNIILLISCLLIINPFYPRTTSLLMIPQAITNIYQQQYQMGLFLKRFNQGEPIAVNDIGAISYLAEPKLLDLVGLGSNQVTKYKRAGKYNTETISKLSRNLGTKIAIVYDHWFVGNKSIPDYWVKVGSWTIKNNVICGGDTVSFYATNIAEKNKLISNLKSFKSELPQTVTANLNKS